MSSSPAKKRLKHEKPNELKRTNQEDGCSPKRIKSDVEMQDVSQENNIKLLKRKNFILACKKVSSNAYFNLQSRFHLQYNLPKCLTNNNCVHHDSSQTVIPISNNVEQDFNAEFKTNMWFDALEICQMCITPTSYLTANVLKKITEIILNAHEDEYLGYPVASIIDDAQQMLATNFITHPPCLKSLRKCYNDFLRSPLDLKDRTFSNRSHFASDKGIVIYCLNRLEYELSFQSPDEPLVDRNQNTPEDMKLSVKGLFWQKENFEIYETLNRSDRIERLMAVLESVIELLQLDMALWVSRYKTNQSRHMMRSDRTLMASVLWSDNILYTRAVNNTTKQILRLFIQIVHLDFNIEDKKIMALWLNTVVQTFYLCHNKSNTNYPFIEGHCNIFAKRFYELMCNLPKESIVKVIAAVEPTFMRYLVGIEHIQEIMSTSEHDILKIIIEFINTSHWKKFKKSKHDLLTYGPVLKRTSSRKAMKELLKLFENIEHDEENDEGYVYPRQNEEPNVSKEEIDQNHVIYTLYLTLDAYLDAFSVQDVQINIETLNEMIDGMSIDDDGPSTTGDQESSESSYLVSDCFIKKYREIYQLLAELRLLLEELNAKKSPPQAFGVFKKISLLCL